MFAEHFLQHTKAAIVIGQPFDSGDIGPVHLRHKCRAGFDGFPVDIHGASAAMAGFAADMRTGDFQIFPQEVDQQSARLGQTFDLLAVHGEFDVHFRHEFSSPQAARLCARSMARRSITAATCFLNSTGRDCRPPGRSRRALPRRIHRHPRPPSRAGSFGPDGACRPDWSSQPRPFRCPPSRRLRRSRSRRSCAFAFRKPVQHPHPEQGSKSGSEFPHPRGQ